MYPARGWVSAMSSTGSDGGLALKGFASLFEESEWAALWLERHYGCVGELCPLIDFSDRCLSECTQGVDLRFSWDLWNVYPAMEHHMVQWLHVEQKSSDGWELWRTGSEVEE